jgi:NAD(P)-dependent dehydrogenase (short-subunit alcohol dehydrogenase family)
VLINNAGTNESGRPTDQLDGSEALEVLNTNVAEIVQYAHGLPDIRVNAADPGYTATDLNRHSGHQTLTEGTDAIVTLATEDPKAGTGRFIDRFGPVRW